MAGWDILSSTANIQGGDNYGAPQFYVEEYIIPQEVLPS